MPRPFRTSISDVAVIAVIAVVTVVFISFFAEAVILILLFFLDFLFHRQHNRLRCRCVKVDVLLIFFRLGHISQMLLTLRVPNPMTIGASPIIANLAKLLQPARRLLAGLLALYRRGSLIPYNIVQMHTASYMAAPAGHQIRAVAVAAVALRSLVDCLLDHVRVWSLAWSAPRYLVQVRLALKMPCPAGDIACCEVAGFTSIPL